MRFLIHALERKDVYLSFVFQPFPRLEWECNGRTWSSHLKPDGRATYGLRKVGDKIKKLQPISTGHMMLRLLHEKENKLPSYLNHCYFGFCCSRQTYILRNAPVLIRALVVGFFFSITGSPICTYTRKRAPQLTSVPFITQHRGLRGGQSWLS